MDSSISILFKMCWITSISYITIEIKEVAHIG